MRDRSERIHNTEAKLKRKIEIVKNTYGSDPQCLLNNPAWVGKLKKGKVHCSCPICTFKSKTHGIKHCDRKRLME